MRRTSLLLLALALLAAAPAARAQFGLRMSTVVDNMVGAAGDTNEASLLFSREGERLCLTVAIPTGPTALRAKLFRFAKRVEGEVRSDQLEFPLPGKPEKPPGDNAGHLRVWEGCLAAAEGEGDAGAMIDIQYRDPRRLKDLAEYAVAYPGPDSSQGVEVLKDSAGNLMFRSFRPNPETAM